MVVGLTDHSKMGRQYLTTITSDMNAIAIDDESYAQYYQPNKLLDVF